MTTAIYAEGDLKIGVHPTVTFAGLTFNTDTILSTVVAGALVLILGFILRARVTSSGVPGKLQVAWEGLVKFVEDQVEGLMGVRVAPFVVPLSVALFSFILFANWIELVPTDDALPAPTADVNTTYALALLVIIWLHAASVRHNGIRKYLAHYAKPFKISIFFNTIEELVKPVSLSLRLFGNIFAGGIMIGIISLMPAYVLWLPNTAWKLFDMFVGAIQALIFTLLTITYFGMQLSSSEEH